MIDYEKLKEAHELAENLNSRVSVNVCYLVADKNPTFILDCSDFKRNITSYNIEAIIDRLKELTKPEPKYKVGNSCWYYCEGEIFNYIPSSIEWDDNRHVWACKNEHQHRIDENELYPSRIDLIEAQLNYWREMLDEEFQLTPKDTADAIKCFTPPFEGEIKGFKDKCEHEPDSMIHTFYDEGGKLVMKRCAKCGEFY